MRDASTKKWPWLPKVRHGLFRGPGGEKGPGGTGNTLAAGNEHDQSQPASSHEAARRPYHTLRGAPHRESEMPFQVPHLQEEGASAISPLEKAGHLSSSILYAHCSHYLTKYSFPSALLLFWPPNHRSCSLEPAPSQTCHPTACHHLPPFPPVADNVLTPPTPKLYPSTWGAPNILVNFCGCWTQPSILLLPAHYMCWFLWGSL